MVDTSRFAALRCPDEVGDAVLCLANLALLDNASRDRADTAVDTRAAQASGTAAAFGLASQAPDNEGSACEASGVLAEMASGASAAQTAGR